LAKKDKLDRLIDQLEKLTEFNFELGKLIVKSPLVPLPPAVKKQVIVGAELGDPIRQDITGAYFDGLRAGISGIRSPRGQESIDVLSQMPITGPVQPVKPKPRSKKQKAYAKKQSSAFKDANAKLRTKRGQLRKGKTQSDVARLAQKILKKSLVGKAIPKLPTRRRR